MPSRKRSGSIIWFALMMMAIAVVAYYLLRGHQPRPSRPNVLWITMDSFRGDHLGCVGYGPARTPNIDALAREGALFTGSISQSTYTRISVPSMITGKYPYFTGLRMLVPDLDSSNVTLAEALAAQGYSTYAIGEHWQPGFFQGFQKVDQSDDSTVRKTQWCLEALQKLDERPFFIWLYYWDPHAPYAPPVEFMRLYEPDYVWEEGQTYSRPRTNTPVDKFRDSSGHFSGAILLLLSLNQGKIIPTPEDRQHLVNLYDAEIALVDSKIKEVIDQLKSLGLWENTLVILNADHGEAFGEHGHYYHGYSIYEEEVRVPLIIKPPGTSQTGRAVDGPVRNLDIMPTILDYCGIAPPAGIQGQSLRPFIEQSGSPNLPSCIETHRIQTQTHLVGYRDGYHKLIYNLTQGGSELYDLEADPHERDNLLVGKSDERTARLEANLQKSLLQALGVQSLVALKLGEMPTMIDQETKEQLKALGYVY